MTRERLEGFSAQLLAVAPEDKKAITELCLDMKQTRQEIEDDSSCASVTLDLALQALQAVINDELEDASYAIDSVIMAIAITAKYVDAGDEAFSVAELQKVIGGLQSLLPPAAADGTSEVDVPKATSTIEETPPTAISTSAPEEVSSNEETDDLWLLCTDTDVELLGEFIEECLDRIVQGEASLLELESNPSESNQIDEIFRAFHTIKGTAGFLELNAIQQLSHLAENLLDRAREGEIQIVGGYADLSLRSCDILREMISGLSGAKPGSTLTKPDGYDLLVTHLSDPEAAGFGSETSVANTADSTTSSQNSTGVDSDEEDETVEAASEEKPVRKQGSATESDSSIRVSTARLDSLINMAGELVIAHSMVGQDELVTDGKNPRLTKNIGHSGKIIRELQDLAMALRMVPLKGTFRKMQRLVRDLGRKANKAVRFVTEGEETEIDRNMVEAIADPLVHMIRNALDHGLENMDERKQSGKDATGTVSLRAYHSAGNVVIELQDDGRGLNREKIIAKAIDRGVIEPDRELTDREAFGLIFAAGLSTAEKVTNISGRGVGMDVVRSSIEKLSGRVEVNSEPEKGTKITLRLPLTMAISDSMLLGVGQERFLLPIPFISQTFRPEPGSISTVKGSGTVVSLRGQLLPLFRLHELFDIQDAQTVPHEGLVVLIEAEGRTCALLVDGIVGQQQVVIKSLGPMFGQVSGVSGGAILGDGRIGLILDASGIIKLATKNNERRRLPRPTQNDEEVDSTLEAESAQ